MPKLNVQQNNANVIKALRNALAIGQIKGPIASDGNDNFTSTGSNRNLLDNAYFVGGGSQLGDGIFPINQRGQTSYSNGTNTTIDRWKTEASAISVDADGLTWTATGDNNQFEQIIENYKLIEGETYTATIDCDISAGSARLFVGGVVYPWPTVAGSAVNSSGITKVTFTFARESGYTGQYKLALASVGSCTAKLRKFKLEKGSYSTVVNDAPPDYGKELEKCKRYLQRVKQPQGYTASVGFGMVGAASNILRTTIPLSSPLRNAASITATATNTGQMFVCGNGSYYSVTGVTGRTVLNGNAIVDITVNGTLENYKTYNLILNNADAYIDLYAPL